MKALILPLVLMAAVVCNSFAGPNLPQPVEGGLKCQTCKGTGFNGNFNCFSCKGTGRFSY
jgi:DnaJ-class molecular chaperone